MGGDGGAARGGGVGVAALVGMRLVGVVGTGPVVVVVLTMVAKTREVPALRGRRREAAVAHDMMVVVFLGYSRRGVVPAR